jgi:hypothetical protein
MIEVCAWCPPPTAPPRGPSHAAASHGICPSCLAQQLAALEARRPVGLGAVSASR